MNLQSVCIYHLRMTADGGKIKTAFSFLNEIFHLSTAAVKLDYLVWFRFHGCHNECEQVDHLPVWLLDLEDHPPWPGPAAGLVHELPIFHGVPDLILPGRAVQRVILVLRLLTEHGILFKPDRVIARIILAGLVQVRGGEAAVTTKVERYGRILCPVFLHQRDHELVCVFAAVLGTVTQFRLQQISRKAIIAEERVVTVGLAW